MAQNFPRSQRLHQREEFGRVLQTKASINKWIALYVAPNESDTKRLGIVASKRVMVRAVDRNRTKRAIREVFRQSPRSARALDVIVRVRCCPKSNEVMDFRRSLTFLLTEKCA